MVIFSCHDPEQCFAARVVLGWSREELAKRAGRKAWGVRRFERGDQVAPWYKEHIEDTLTEAGIRFIEDWGVCLKAKSRARKRTRRAK